jgi:hypothetical protein
MVTITITDRDPDPDPDISRNSKKVSPDSTGTDTVRIYRDWTETIRDQPKLFIHSNSVKTNSSGPAKYVCYNLEAIFILISQNNF